MAGHRISVQHSDRSTKEQYSNRQVLLMVMLTYFVIELAKRTNEKKKIEELQARSRLEGCRTDCVKNFTHPCI